MDLNNDFQSQAPIWIRLSELPLEYWHEDVFDGIARTFRELLSIDPVTVAKKRLTYARICIGVNEGQDMPQFLELQSRLGNRSQKIVYESVPFACFHYKKAGHKAGSCPLFKGKSMGGKARSQGGNKSTLNPKKEWKKKAMQAKENGEVEGKTNTTVHVPQVEAKENGEAEGKTNNVVHVPQEESGPLRVTGNAVEGEEKGLTVDQIILSHVKETKKKPEETGKNETHTLLASQEVYLNLSFVPNAMEGLKEGEPTSQESSLSPVCCPPLQ